MSRLQLTITIASFFVTAVSGAVELKIATLAPERTAWVQDMRRGAKEINERTGGRVEIKLYVGGIQGDDKQVLRAIRIGRLQGAAFTPMALQDIYADVNIYGLPFLFESQGEIDYVRKYLDEKLLKGLEQAGFICFGFSNGGFAYLMSNEPVTGLADLKGKRVWVPEGDRITYAAVEALDLSPVTLPMADVLTGLQTGLVDIVALPPVTTLALQWHTRVKYLTEMPLLYAIGLMAVDAKAFQRLSEADQAIVRDVMTDIYEGFSVREPEDNRDAKQALLNSGVRSVPPAAGELDRIREIMQRTNRQLGENGFFSMELYEELLGHLEDYRNRNATVGSVSE